MLQGRPIVGQIFWASCNLDLCRYLTWSDRLATSRILRWSSGIHNVDPAQAVQLEWE